MILKWTFDRVMALVGLIALCWLYPIVAILIKIRMPGGPVFFVQKRVGKDGKLFNCHKFRTMRVNDSVDGNRLTVKGDRLVNKTESQNGGWSTVSVAGDSRITPFGAKLRHYKIDELPELWDVFIGKMSFVGPRPDVPGYADKLEGEDRVILKLRPGITGPATLKYRLEDEMIAEWVKGVRLTVNGERLEVNGERLEVNGERLEVNGERVEVNGERLEVNGERLEVNGERLEVNGERLKVNGERLEVNGERLTVNGDVESLREKSENNLIQNLPKCVNEMTDQELAVWYNDNVIYPDKVRLNRYYYEHYSFWKDIQMIVCTVLGKKMKYAGEVI